MKKTRRFEDFAARLDPFHSGVWRTASAQASWFTFTQMRAQADSGLIAEKLQWSLSKEEAWETLFSRYYRAEMVAVLGALLQWRTLTGQQLSAFVGSDKYAARFTSPSSSRLMRALWRLGFVEVGLMPTFGMKNNKDAPTLWRPRNTGNMKRLWKDLSFAQRIAISGGREPLVQHLFDRHNTLTTELALRFCQLAEAGGVLGESLASFDDLSGGRWSSLPGVHKASNPMADGVLVRPDGVRIALELTVTTGSFFKKAMRWAKLLEATPYDESGLVVCFVSAPPAEAPRHLRKEVRKTLRKALAHVQFQHPGVRGDLTASRICVAQWEDWFPARGEVSPSFPLLSAKRPTGGPESLFEDVSLMDVFDLPSPTAPGLDALGPQTLKLAGTPAFFARRFDDDCSLDLMRFELAQLGLSKPLVREGELVKSDTFAGARTPIALAFKSGMVSAPPVSHI